MRVSTLVRFAFCACALVVSAGPGAADLPDPTCIICSLDQTERLLLIPDENGVPQGEFTMIVRNMWGGCEPPIADAIVEVLIGGQAQGKTRLCGSAVYTGRTDENGFVRMNVTGGGCYKGANAVVIRVNGVEVRAYQVVVSPDYAGWDNQGQPNRSSLSVSLADLAAFVMAYQGGTGGASCHDYDNNGRMDPGDLAVFAAAYQGGIRACAP